MPSAASNPNLFFLKNLVPWARSRTIGFACKQYKRIQETEYKNTEEGIAFGSVVGIKPFERSDIL